MIYDLAAWTSGCGDSADRSMEFNHFLSAYPDTAYGGERLYADMVSQAKLVDRLGYRGVTIPEHHLINILLVPDPLQLAVKVASVTSRIERRCAPSSASSVRTSPVTRSAG
jgi:Luciferase-like monooxygenase